MKMLHEFPNPATVSWTGSRYVDVANPRAEDISLYEIAVGLSREQRYRGAATRMMWSVAKHSLCCLRYAQDDGVDNPVVLRVILLHDAPEYILGDMVRPVKALCPDYRALEEKWWRAIAHKFLLPFVMHPAVGHYDQVALSSEKESLISEAAGAWTGTLPARPLPADIVDLGEVEARERFLMEAWNLGIEA